MLKKIAPCFYAIIIDALGFGLVYPVMAAIFTSHNSPVLGPHSTAAEQNFLLGISYLLYPLFMFFGSSFMGDLSDNWGRKKVITLCMAGITVSFAFMAFGVVASSITLLFLGRALSGLMAGSQAIAQASIADLSTPDNKAKNIGLISLSYSFGTILGPLLGGVLADHQISVHFNFSTPFWVSAVLALLAFLWLLFGFKDTSKVTNKKKVSLLRPILIFIEAFQHKSVRLLVFVYLLMQIGWGTYFQFLIVHMRHAYHYSNWQMGAVQGLFGIGFGIGILVGIPYLTKRMSTHKAALLTLLITGLCELLSAFIHPEIAQWILAILVACFDMIAFSMMLTLFSDAVSESQQGWVMGITGSVMSVAWVISGFGSNLLSITTTSVLIGVGGVFLLLSALLLLKHHRTSSASN